MKKLKIFLRLNLYALLLDLVCLTAILLTFYIQNVIINTVLFISILVISSYSFRLHSTFRQKYKTYLILLKGNEKRFRPHTFQKYMNAPCTRQIVWQVLEDINRKKQFLELKKKYQVSIFAPKVSRTRIVLYKDGNIANVFESDSLQKETEICHNKSTVDSKN